MKSASLFVGFVLSCIASAATAADTTLDTEKVIDQARTAASATSAHQAAIKASGIEEAAKALAEERKKDPPDHGRIAELATALGQGLKQVADVESVISTLDELREQFHDTADRLREEAQRGAGNATLITDRLAAPYDAKMRALAARIKELPADGTQVRRLREDFAFNMAMRDEARRQAASARADSGVDMRGLAEKYDRAAGAVLATKRELLARSMKLNAAAGQLETLATMTKAAKALDDATASVTTLGQATEMSLREVDGTMRLLDRVFDTILAKVTASTDGTPAVTAPSPEELERELQEYSRPATPPSPTSRSYYRQSGRNR